MKKHLERKVKAGKSKPKLKELDPTVLPAAWSILRWYATFHVPVF
jgi:ubiquitin-conjugating enzyme E2 Q